MSQPNFVDKTIWTGDNLDIMRGMNSESVDLIYLDPPLNSNRNYAAPVGSNAAGAAFKDTWTLSDLDVAWMGLIADEQPAMYQVLQAADLTHGKGMQSYLCMMGVRLLEMRRVLKDTGSIYLHCDPTASHYLKLLMDAVFGDERFGNEIVWARTQSKSLMKRRLPSNHDLILAYRKTEAATWNHDLILAYRKTEAATWNHDALFQPYGENALDAKTAAKYSHRDPDGRIYRLDNLINPNQDRPNLTYEFLGITRVWRWTKERMQAAYDEGLVVQTRPGAVPSLKRYLDEQRGRPLGDVWADISPINSQARERIGYPTQKPLALLERIIRASSNPGDMVLDPFCGCATACVAAENLGRQWVGIDLSAKAVELVNMRLQQSMGSLFHHGYVTHRTDIPRRTDIEAPINYRKQKHVLFGQQEGLCGGCKEMFPFRNFTIDHVVPQSRGGTDHLENLQLLCGVCNSLKGDRDQPYLVTQLKKSGII